MSPSSTSSSDPPRGRPQPEEAATAKASDERAETPTGATVSDERPEGPTRATATNERAESPTTAASSSRRALLLCIGLLLLLEVGAARRDWLWRIDPRRPVGILLEVEDRIIAPAGDLRVVVLGSSVMRDALLPRVFEQAAGLPEGSAVNTSLPNATPFDFVLLYERNRAAFRRARLMLVGVEEWFLFEEPDVSERYHRWASLSERLADYEGSARLPLLVSWVWQTYAARQSLAIEGLAAALRGERADVIGDDGRTRWRPQEQAVGPESFPMAAYEARLRERRWRDPQVRYLAELATLATADELPLVLVRMPMRATAMAARERVDPGAEPRLQEALQAARRAAPATRVLDLPVGGPIGLGDRHFLDERHLGTDGAVIFSPFLAEWALRLYDLGS